MAKRGVQTTIYNKFRGADFSTDPMLVDKSRSPLCTNMVNDGGGMPEKRMGWRTLHRMSGRINGIHSAKLGAETVFFVHAGTTLYRWDGAAEPEAIYEGAADHKSRSAIMGGKLWIVTGAEMLRCDSEGVHRMTQEDAYIPTTVITRMPSGGGVPYEDVNLLSPFRRNGFQTDGAAKTFVLDAKALDTVLVAKTQIAAGTKLYYRTGTARYFCFETAGEIAAGAEITLDFEKSKMRSGSQTVEMTAKNKSTGYSDMLDKAEMDERSTVTATVWGEEETAFTVDREAGSVTFETAPAAPDAGAADGLVITFPKSYEAFSQGTIDRCTIITTFGIGTGTRLVLAGNTDYPNRDWISAHDDGTYFPDLGYSTIGQEDGAIRGYSRVGNLQAIVKEDTGKDSTVFFRSAEITAEGTVQFSVKPGITGVGAVNEGGFATLLDEPLFVSSTGIYAVTTNYLTGDRVGQNRSFYINKKLTDEDLTEAEAVSWKGMYLLLLPNGHVYILDGRQNKTYQSESLGDFVYEGYYWEDVPARCVMNWKHGAEETLLFGTEDGRLCRFNDDIDGIDRYSDDGAAIKAVWATKSDDDGDSTMLKTMLKRGCAVTLSPFQRSSAKICFRTDRDATDYQAAYGTMDIFDWEDIDFSRFTFNANDEAQEIFFNAKVKKYKRLQIIIRSEGVNEGFGVFGITKHFVFGNYAKR